MSKDFRLIRCPIHGSIEFNQREVRLIDSPFLQRLRSVSQLGFASLVFPGAVHSRFSHSLGAAHLIGKVFDQLKLGLFHDLSDFYGKEDLQYFRQILRFAALLHDVGHPPFSHAAERVLPMISSLEMPPYLMPKKDRQATHEDFSHAIIYHMAKEQNLLSLEEAEDVISVLSKKIPPSHRMNAKEGGPLIYPLLCQLINGEIDVDRMDYLHRDAHFAGVPYGKFDLDRMIGSFSTCLEESLGGFLLTINSEDLPTYENFLLSRIHMFYQIYFHKTLGAFTHYIQQVFEEREITLAIDGSMENYLSLNENGLREELRKNQHKKWAGRIINRQPAKTLLRVKDQEPERMERLERVQALLQQEGVDCFLVNSWNNYSTQIKGRPINQSSIMVIEQELGKERLYPLGERSGLLGNEERLIEIHQLYVHREEFQQAMKIIEGRLT